MVRTIDGIENRKASANIIFLIKLAKSAPHDIICAANDMYYWFMPLLFSC